jgi:HSP20 family protein
MATLPVRKSESIFDEIEKMNDRIMRRAHEIFLGNGSIFGQDLDNWFAAERELVWKPAIELHEKDDELFVNVAVSGVDPKDIEIEITPEDLLVKGEVRHEHTEDKGTVHTCEFASGHLFRTIHLPERIDPNKVKAEFKNGMLHLKAPIAKEQRARKVAAEAA